MPPWKNGRARGPYKFYFTDAFNRKTPSFIEPSAKAKKLGDVEDESDIENVPVDWPMIPRPLYMKDVFAGCGGNLRA